jgi:tetratricopeptide (TPR) repeat protein
MACVGSSDNKAAALNNLGNYTGAIEFYDKSLAIDPKNTYGLTNKLIIKSKSRITQAMKLFSEVSLISCRCSGRIRSPL